MADWCQVTAWLPQNLSTSGGRHPSDVATDLPKDLTVVKSFDAQHRLQLGGTLLQVTTERVLDRAQAAVHRLPAHPQRRRRRGNVAPALKVGAQGLARDVPPVSLLLERL